jgi:hypothetical protein
VPSHPRAHISLASSRPHRRSFVFSIAPLRPHAGAALLRPGRAAHLLPRAPAPRRAMNRLPRPRSTAARQTGVGNGSAAGTLPFPQFFPQFAPATVDSEANRPKGEMQQSSVRSIPRRVVPTTGVYGRMTEDEINAEQFEEGRSKGRSGPQSWTRSIRCRKKKAKGLHAKASMLNRKKKRDGPKASRPTRRTICWREK